MNKRNLLLALLSFASTQANSQTPLEESFIELNQIKVHSPSSRRIISSAKKSLIKVHRELLSLSFEEKIHELKAHGVVIENFNLQLSPLKSIDMLFIDQQMDELLSLEKIINQMKIQISQSSIIKIDRSLMSPYLKLQENIAKYNMDMGIFRTRGFVRYSEMLDFAKENTNLKKSISNNTITYSVDQFSEKFCRDYIEKQISTEFIYENHRSFITEPLLGQDLLKNILDELYKDCNETR